MDIWVIIFGICLPITIVLGLLAFDGIKQCQKNNIFGILRLTISLNIIGAFIGCMIIYKKQNPEFKFWKNKCSKIFKFKKRNKKIAV
ncbi:MULTISPECIES: hypothetical protein [unclassified Spiroplasma]|uniref:hypothetical protein n=1 Tax=unclassified Spiroplasma TaxID=2637901 RepID=UPI0030CB2AB2